jgi:hypothetical protein
MIGPAQSDRQGDTGDFALDLYCYLIALVVGGTVYFGAFLLQRVSMGSYGWVSVSFSTVFYSFQWVSLPPRTNFLENDALGNQT